MDWTQILTLFEINPIRFNLIFSTLRAQPDSTQNLVPGLVSPKIGSDLGKLIQIDLTVTLATTLHVNIGLDAELKNIWQNRQTDKQTSRQTDKQTNRQAGKQASRQTAKQTNRQRNKQTKRQTDIYVCQNSSWDTHLCQL